MEIVLKIKPPTIEDECDCCGHVVVKEESIARVLLDIRRLLYPTPAEIEQRKRMEPMLRMMGQTMLKMIENPWEGNKIMGDIITINKPPRYSAVKVEE